ncbi:hypothetical protein ABH912_003298 [Pseudomonas sp. BT76 TE3572]|uniref:hypothetical protein n=1 Tax=Pseudomonas sp. BT76 TE3572 TaxID=3349325 RepID=UPI003D1989A3
MMLNLRTAFAGTKRFAAGDGIGGRFNQGLTWHGQPGIKGKQWLTTKNPPPSSGLAGFVVQVF